MSQPLSSPAAISLTTARSEIMMVRYRLEVGMGWKHCGNGHQGTFQVGIGWTRLTCAVCSSATRL